MDHNNGDWETIYTSWTYSVSVANWHANKSIVPGVVLTKTFPEEKIVSSPDNYDEMEVLIPGVVQGATVNPPSGPGTPNAFGNY